MKKIIFSLAFLLISTISFAQAPEKINYQAVARNLSGVPLVNQTINVKYEIRQGSSTGALVYAENHTLTTNQFGLFTAEVGGGTVINGTFSGIAWGTNPFYLYVEVDGDPMGVTQLLSVPYALYAKESGNGPQGLNSLMDTLSAGAACPNGGQQIVMGLDANNNGALEAGEITKSFVICNGTVGPQGSAGIAGTNGVDGTNGLACWDTNGDGIQDAGEDVNLDGFWDALDCAGA
ncbi:MAG: hypothetical protein HYU68_12710, partial [Bacteroidetes bacterium]|nr:hypothetical protein [Bacteroidota bacterium]